MPLFLKIYYNFTRNERYTIYFCWSECICLAEKYYIFGFMLFIYFTRARINDVERWNLDNRRKVAFYRNYMEYVIIDDTHWFKGRRNNVTWENNVIVEISRSYFEIRKSKFEIRNSIREIVRKIAIIFKETDSYNPKIKRFPRYIRLLIYLIIFKQDLDALNS